MLLYSYLIPLVGVQCTYIKFEQTYVTPTRAYKDCADLSLSVRPTPVHAFSYSTIGHFENIVMKFGVLTSFDPRINALNGSDRSIPHTPSHLEKSLYIKNLQSSKYFYTRISKNNLTRLEHVFGPFLT